MINDNGITTIMLLSFGFIASFEARIIEDSVILSWHHCYLINSIKVKGLISTLVLLSKAKAGKNL